MDSAIRPSVNLSVSRFHKFYKPVLESLVLNTYASSESLKRRDVRDVDEGSGQKFRDRS